MVLGCFRAFLGRLWPGDCWGLGETTDDSPSLVSVSKPSAPPCPAGLDLVSSKYFVGASVRHVWSAPPASQTNFYFHSICSPYLSRIPGISIPSWLNALNCSDPIRVFATVFVYYGGHCLVQLVSGSWYRATLCFEVRLSLKKTRSTCFGDI